MKRAGEAGIALRASRVEPLSKWPPASRHRDLSPIQDQGAALGFDAIAAISSGYRRGVVVLNFWANMVYGTAS